MNTRQIFSIIVLALGLTAAILPNKRNDSFTLNEEELLQEMLLGKNYVSTDELADLLISGDPSIQIIDVRPAEEFKDPIRGAINIPIDSLFSDTYGYLFDQLVMKNIIYSENDQLATQVWMITKQLGYKNNYLLKGGLNAWESTILDPETPSQSASVSEWDIYRRRMAARQYFTGAKALPKVDVTPILPIQGRKKKKVQGGCS
ncbi:MAG: hypothetical protein CMJ19_25040 [Phycisphaeraceae bacterium]|nr:hypothetical protein [Phycisphaeraceae bacterium]